MLVAQPDPRVQEAESCLVGAIALAQRREGEALGAEIGNLPCARLWATLGSTSRRA